MLKDCLVTFHNGGFIETGYIDSVNLTLSNYWWFKNGQNLLVSVLNWVERSHRYLSKTFTLNIRVTSYTVATSLTTRPPVTVLPFSIWTNDVPHIPNFNLNRIHKNEIFALIIFFILATIHPINDYPTSLSHPQSKVGINLHFFSELLSFGQFLSLDPLLRMKLCFIRSTMLSMFHLDKLKCNRGNQKVNIMITAPNQKACKYATHRNCWIFRYCKITPTSWEKWLIRYGKNSFEKLLIINNKKLFRDWTTNLDR